MRQGMRVGRWVVGMVCMGWFASAQAHVATLAYRLAITRSPIARGTLYREYYRGRQRGFTGAEFQQICERMAGQSLTELFTYVDTTAAPDYARYFFMAGLTVDTAEQPTPQPADHKPSMRGERGFLISPVASPDALQDAILRSF